MKRISVLILVILLGSVANAELVWDCSDTDIQVGETVTFSLISDPSIEELNINHILQTNIGGQASNIYLSPSFTNKNPGIIDGSNIYNVSASVNSPVTISQPIFSFDYIFNSTDNHPKLFDVDGYVNAGTTALEDIYFMPEPSTLVLFSLGLLSLSNRKIKLN